MRRALRGECILLPGSQGSWWNPDPDITHVTTPRE
jgi:hypothetical protein